MATPLSGYPSLTTERLFDMSHQHPLYSPLFYAITSFLQPKFIDHHVVVQRRVCCHNVVSKLIWKKSLHCMCHSLQMMLLSRIFSFNRSRIPLKFFHFGDVNFPLKREKLLMSYIATLAQTAHQSEPRHQRPLLFFTVTYYFWLIDPLFKSPVPNGQILLVRRSGRFYQVSLFT